MYSVCLMSLKLSKKKNLVLFLICFDTHFFFFFFDKFDTYFLFLFSTKTFILFLNNKSQFECLIISINNFITNSRLNQPNKI